MTAITTHVVTEAIAADAVRRRLPAPDSLQPADLQAGDLGRELVASALLMVAVLSSTGLVLGTLLGALWLFG